MRPSLRFLSLAVVGWIGIRAATLGAIPGAEIFKVDPPQAQPPAIVPTQFAPIEPLPPAVPAAAAGAVPPAMQYYQPAVVPVSVRTVPVPVYYPYAPPPVSTPQPAQLTPIMPTPRPAIYQYVPGLDAWPLMRSAAVSMPPTQPAQTAVQAVAAAPAGPSKLDRIQMSTWALLREQQGALIGAHSLSSGGSLGASQAGARLLYNFNRQLAVALRTSSDVGRRGGEVALGVRVQPILGLPLWFTAERRQRLGQFGGGRNDFALFAETGIYQRALPWRLQLDAYGEAGVVGVRTRDMFVDGGLTVTRPIFGSLSFGRSKLGAVSVGAGIWGGAQPGLSRLDAGPRISVRVRSNVRVHLDWRQRLAGNALPGSGPAITLATDF
jgi:hypothetical protein